MLTVKDPPAILINCLIPMHTSLEIRISLTELCNEIHPVVTYFICAVDFLIALICASLKQSNSYNNTVTHSIQYMYL